MKMVKLKLSVIIKITKEKENIFNIMMMEIIKKNVIIKIII
jgi:hypothetical protein